MAGFLSNIYAFMRGKECPYTQFFKYVICGFISVGIDAVSFYLLAWLVFPCLQVGDPIARLLTLFGFTVREVTDEVLIRNY